MALCGGQAGLDLQPSLVQAFEALEPGGHLLLSLAGFTTGMTPEVVAPELLLAQVGFVERQHLLYWSRDSAILVTRK